MPLWKTTWRNGDEEAPSWGKVPGLHVGETVRLQVVGGEQGDTFGACVRAVGMKRIVLDLLDQAVPAVPTPLIVSFVRGDALYQFQTQAIATAWTRSLTVAFPRQVVRLQRRQFYRLPLEWPTTFRVLDEDGGVGSAPYAARLVNLSGGGALLAATDSPIPPGVTLVVRIPAGRDGGSLAVEASVLQCRVATQDASRLYLARLRFLGAPRLSDERRSAVIAYLHEQQRLMRRTHKLLRG